MNNKDVRKLIIKHIISIYLKRYKFIPKKLKKEFELNKNTFIYNLEHNIENCFWLLFEILEETSKKSLFEYKEPNHEYFILKIKNIYIKIIYCNKISLYKVVHKKTKMIKKINYE